MSDNLIEHKIIIVTAPSGSGKTTIVKALLEQIKQLQFSVSATTRNARKTEQDGKDYHFLSVEEFKQKIDEDAFAEFEQVYKNKFYGTLKAKLNEIWLSKKFPLVDIDVKGAQKLKKLYPENSLSIFIQAPSIEILEERLRKRGTDSDDMIKERVGKAEEELAVKDTFDAVVTNDQLEKAIDQCKKLVTDFIS